MSNKAVRAIITNKNNILVMFRNKHGSKYYTLVGGEVDPGESLEDALLREINEETGLQITSYNEVFYELHKPPYLEQHIYACEVASYDEVKIQSFAEESMMNLMGMNVHKPMWVSFEAFERLPFRTPQLHRAVIDGLRDGFPDKPTLLN
jgi:ADP-ribose pyrophosphatase YjhB (NUDIX family)